MPDPIVNVRELFRLSILGKHPEPVTIAEEKTDMMLIGVGYPRTGTGSLRIALQRLGLKSYHMRSAMMSEDVKLWYEHSLQRLEGKPGIYPKIVESIAEQGYNATVDVPNCLYYKELMELYPNAKVLLGIRVEGGGASYAKSVLNSIARFGPLLHRVPLKWFKPYPRTIHEWHFAAQGSPVDDTTRLPKYQDLVDSYEKWNQQILETVPPEKLLVFRSTDGWEPLCNFLSPLDISIERNCQQVLENNEPFPFANDTAALQAVQSVIHWIAVIIENGPTIFIFGCIVWWLVARMQEYGSRGKPEKRKTA